MAAEPSTLRKFVSFALLALGLGILGIGFGVLGAFLAGNVAGENNFGALGLGILGALVGYVAGIFLGLLGIKKLLHVQGSLLFGLVAVITWAVVSVIIAAVLGLTSDHSMLVFVAFFFSVPVVALAGYRLNLWK